MAQIWPTSKWQLECDQCFLKRMGTRASTILEIKWPLITNKFRLASRGLRTPSTKWETHPELLFKAISASTKVSTLIKCLEKMKPNHPFLRRLRFNITSNKWCKAFTQLFLPTVKPDQERRIPWKGISTCHIRISLT